MVHPRWISFRRGCVGILVAGVLGVFTGCAGSRPVSGKSEPTRDAASCEGVVDLDGQAQCPFPLSGARAVVLIFVSIECPICNRYAPEIQRLENQFSKQGVTFWLVQPSMDESVDQTRRYLSEYGYTFGLLRDPRQSLVRRADARVTPEAVVFVPGGKVVYRGRIDDRHAALGKARPAPTRRELSDALEAVLAGRPVAVANTQAVGCTIPRD
ncbi:MAG: redoxin domain-containing protein [Verrucomicrobiales bacterium]|nr:redoxin domain-containing protein [Verrucomicrobiales bacterium]